METIRLQENMFVMIEDNNLISIRVETDASSSTIVLMPLINTYLLEIRNRGDENGFRAALTVIETHMLSFLCIQNAMLLNIMESPGTAHAAIDIIENGLVQITHKMMALTVP